MFSVSTVSMSLWRPIPSKCQTNGIENISHYFHSAFCSISQEHMCTETHTHTAIKWVCPFSNHKIIKFNKKFIELFFVRFHSWMLQKIVYDSWNVVQFVSEKTIFILLLVRAKNLSLLMHSTQNNSAERKLRKRRKKCFFFWIVPWRW